MISHLLTKTSSAVDLLHYFSMSKNIIKLIFRRLHATVIIYNLQTNYN